MPSVIAKCRVLSRLRQESERLDRVFFGFFREELKISRRSGLGNWSESLVRPPAGDQRRLPTSESPQPTATSKSFPCPKLTAHPSREELSAYNLGQLPPERAVAIESHISECEPCCETIVGLSSDDTFVGLLKEARQIADGSDG